MVIDILSIPTFDDLKEEFEVELKMEFKWKDDRLNVDGLEKKTNYDPRRFESQCSLIPAEYFFFQIRQFLDPGPFYFSPAITVLRKYHEEI